MDGVKNAQRAQPSVKFGEMGLTPILIAVIAVLISLGM